MKKLFLKPGKEQSLQRFHPWVFSGAIKRTEGNPVEGDLIEVYSSEGMFCGIGHYQPSSISVRLFSFECEEITRDFWFRKLQKAYELRKSLGLTNNYETNIYRLVHGEGDGMPGLIVDIYGKTAVMQSHSLGMYLIRNELASIILEIMGGTLESVYDKSTSTLPFKAPISASDGYLIGAKRNETLSEYGSRFEVSWEEGQKTGFFIDQRENRKLLEQYSKGANVLNTFCYSGGFSVYAAKGGANHVLSVDSSQRAVELTTHNMEINGINGNIHNETCADVFEFLRTDNQLYDLIILDPPAFAKHLPALKNALQAYKRLNATAMRKLRKGGILFTFSCSQVVSKEQFRNAVFSAGVIANREVSILHQLTQPADHPINIYHPEGEYLKGLVLHVH